MMIFRVVNTTWCPGHAVMVILSASCFVAVCAQDAQTTQDCDVQEFSDDAKARTQKTKVAEQTSKQGLQLFRRGKLTEAIELLKQALSMREELYPKSDYPQGHLELSDSLSNLGLLMKYQGQFDEARTYSEQAVEMDRRLYPASRYPAGHVALATSMNNLGTLLESQGEYLKARDYLEQALAMRQRLFPEEQYPEGHIDLAASLNNLGFVLESLGEYVDADSTHRQALEALQRLYPEDRFPQGHVDVATSMNNLAALLAKQARYAEARVYFRQALEICQRLFPQEEYPDGHPDLSDGINNMGYVLMLQGELAPARHYFEQSLKMDRTLYPPGHPRIADDLYNLSRLLASQGEYADAADYTRLSLATERRLYPRASYPEGHPHLADSLINMGVSLRRQGKDGEALEYYQEALEMRRQLFQTDKFPLGHPDLATGLSVLGGLFHSQGKYDEAGNYYRQSLEMKRRLYPPEGYRAHPSLATSLSRLGRLAIDQGAYAEASKYCRQALEMQQQLFPQDQYPLGHPSLVKALVLQGMLHLAEGENAKARQYFVPAMAMRQRLAENFLDRSSEAEALNYLAGEQTSRNALLSVSLKLDVSIDELYAYLWRDRGVVQRVMGARRRVLASITDEATHLDYRRYLDTRRRIARLTLAPADPNPRRAKDRRDKLQTLTRKKEELERKLAASIPMSNQLQAGKAGHEELVKKLPAGTVFVDLIRYARLEQDPNVTGKQGERQTPGYAAFVLAADQSVKRIELGPAKPIEVVVAKWRHEITTGTSSSAAEELRKLVWEPIESRFPDKTRTLFVCPDGPLTALPWAALPGKNKDRVLLEDYACAVVPHGQFLLEDLEHAAAVNNGTSLGSLLAVGNVSYDSIPVADTTQIQLARPTAIGAQVQWPELPGAKAELEEMVRQFDGRHLVQLTGNRAAAGHILAELPKARWAHFATHGFFANAKFRSALRLDESQFSQRNFLVGRERTTVAGRNPLVLSGLVLAGANVSRSLDAFGIPQGDGGILTAESIAGLNLVNLKLVVLSACETGIGDVAGGEGAYGLQRAFHIAGAKNVVASLWKVDDQATMALMRLFYYKLWTEKKSPSQALRESQLSLYHHPAKIGDLAATRGRGFQRVIKLVENLPAEPRSKHAATKLWAAFVLSGTGE
jgi:CHAT domain-containing protein/tetratricopeptide (TPR) repeat protein